ncbi:helix-turn-helix domain-containing protein [Spirillospora sp. NPDC046719]
MSTVTLRRRAADTAPTMGAVSPSGRGDELIAACRRGRVLRAGRSGAGCFRRRPRRRLRHTGALETRLRLIRSARALFAERGIQAGPLRDIHRAAGQRNASAFNYQFSGKEDRPGDRGAAGGRDHTRRLELVRAADSVERGHDVHALVDMVMRPDAVPVRSYIPWPGDGCRRRSPDLDRAVLTMRFQLVLDLGIHTLATYQSAECRSQALTSLTFYVDRPMTGLLIAPTRGARAPVFDDIQSRDTH